MRRYIRKWFDRVFNNGGGSIGVDTAIVAATNALVLLLGARIVASADLSPLAMFQLLIATAVSIQRAFILSPGLAAQRQMKLRASIPLRWIATLSFPYIVAVAIAMPLLVGATTSYWVVAAASLFVAGAAVTQDYLRYVLFSRERANVAVVADLVWLSLFLVGVPLAAVADSWIAFLLVWGASGWVSAFVAVLAGKLWRADRLSAVVSLKATVHLGKWSGGDVLLSSVANLIPMAVTALALGSPAAALYRVLQTAMGPLNIINTTFVASYGLNAWRLTSRRELRALHTRTMRASGMLLVLTAGVLAIAFPLIIAISELSSPDLPRVAAILALSGLLGAATTPLMAASSALGYQRIGLAIRVVVVTFAAVVSLMAVAGLWIPWDDPVGAVAIFSSVAGLMGWGIGYGIARKTENRLLGDG